MTVRAVIILQFQPAHFKRPFDLWFATASTGPEFAMWTPD